MKGIRNDMLSALELTQVLSRVGGSGATNHYAQRIMHHVTADISHDDTTLM